MQTGGGCCPVKSHNPDNKTGHVKEDKLQGMRPVCYPRDQ